MPEPTDSDARLRQARWLDAVGQLTGKIAHDFNNSLAVVIGNLDLLCESLAGQASFAMAETARRGALRGAELANRLLDFSGRQTLHLEPVDLAALVDGMQDVLRRLLADRIELQVTHAGARPILLADAARIEWTLAELATNARRTMPEGGRLHVETGVTAVEEHAAMAPGSYVTLTVADTGAGMAAEILARACEPFFTTRPGARASGLGLSTIYGFARQSGGQLSIDSAPGAGTTVRLHLPRTTPEPAWAAPEPAPHGGGETVLVVDVDEDRRRLSVARLVALGYRSTEADSAVAALARLRQGPRIDVVLAELVAGGAMSGLDLAAEARRAHPGLKVVLTTGLGDLAPPGGDPDAPAEILGKPYRQADLARALRRTLSQ